MKKYVYRLLLLLTVLALAGCGEKKTEAVAGDHEFLEILQEFCFLL